MLKNFVFVIALLMLASVFSASRSYAAPKANGEGAEKKGILLVAFGSSMPEGKRAIDALVDATRRAFPDIEVRLAYTSNIIRRKLKREQNVTVPTPPEALAQMNDDRFTDVCVQPMHVIPGMEYDVLKSVVDAFASVRGKYGFARLVLGRPFLADADDCKVMADILLRRFADDLGADKAVILMGHGSEHQANAMYHLTQQALSKVSDRFFLGTVEAAPTFGDILTELKKTPYKKLILSPLMVVAGDHATNDLAAEDDPESWFSRFKREGYAVETRLIGLGEYPEIAALFVKRVEALME